MTQTQGEEIERLDELAATYRSRLRVLGRQIAAYGIAVPAHVVLDKEQAERDLARTLAELRRLRPAPAGERAPYLGLSTFQERDADLFFGRAALVAELVARVEHTAFLAVLGASGSGKSSVVRAGLLAELRGGALPGSERWRYTIFKPGDRPLDALAAALAKLQGADLGGALALRDQLARDAGNLLFAARMLLDGQGDARLVLVVDQAEELWTLAPSDAEARQKFVAEQQRPFVRLLLAATESERSPVLVVLTMRADFLHRAAEDADLARAIGDHDVIVSPMTADELRSAIARPAEAAGASFEPGLADELVEQVRGRPGALPLLEYTLLELWKARDPDGTLTWQAFKGLGGVEGALAARADAILKERYSTPEQQGQLRRALLRLVQPGEGAADTRRRALLQDLAPAGEPVEVVQALLQPLVDARLIVITGMTTDDGRRTTNDESASADTHALSSSVLRPSSAQVELAHEALIRAWPAFAAWVDTARADLRLQLRLEDAAKEWVESGERPEFLWSGLRLANAEAWQARARPQLNEREQRFLEASQAAQRHSIRIRRWTLGALAALIVAILAIVTGRSVYIAQQQRQDAATAQALADQRARLSRAGELAAQSQAGDEQFSQHSLLLAVAALHVTDPASEPRVPAAEQALRDALANTGGVGLSGHTSPVVAVAFSPDGKRLVTASRDGTARLWNLTATDVTASAVVLRGHTDTFAVVAFSSDGRRLVIGSDDGTARLWDLTAADVASSATVLRGHTSPVDAVAFSPDGKRLVTASRDGTARLWDLTAADLTASATVLGGHTGAVVAVAFSPDGKRLVTGSRDGIARLWNLTAADVASSATVLRGHTDAVDAVAFSPDGKRLVTGSRDGTARLWDLAAADVASSATVLGGHTNWIAAVAFSPDGKRLVTGSDDNTTRLWDLTAADVAASAIVLRGHTDWVRVVAFSPDGKRLVTASDDGTARLWLLDLKELEALACRTAGSNLTWEEWQQYFPGENYRVTCPDLPPHFSVIPHLVVQSADLAKQGKIAEAIAAYKDAQQRYPAFEISAESWNTLCWFGSIAGQAKDVLDACEQAVKLAPDDGDIRDSRGLARALTGNIAGAIEDFTAFIAWAQQHGRHEKDISRRKEWIAALQAGRNPFDAATLEKLRSE